MADKFYHQQPCFCIPCRVMKADGVKQPARQMEEPEQPKKKAKRSKKA
jgi:hypothetical protein